MELLFFPSEWNAQLHFEIITHRSSTYSFAHSLRHYNIRVSNNHAISQLQPCPVDSSPKTIPNATRSGPAETQTVPTAFTQLSPISKKNVESQNKNCKSKLSWPAWRKKMKPSTTTAELIHHQPTTQNVESLPASRSAGPAALMDHSQPTSVSDSVTTFARRPFSAP